MSVQRPCVLSSLSLVCYNTASGCATIETHLVCYNTASGCVQYILKAVFKTMSETPIQRLARYRMISPCVLRNLSAAFKSLCVALVPVSGLYSTLCARRPCLN